MTQSRPLSFADLDGPRTRKCLRQLSPETCRSRIPKHIGSNAPDLDHSDCQSVTPKATVPAPHSAWAARRTRYVEFESIRKVGSIVPPPPRRRCAVRRWLLATSTSSCESARRRLRERCAATSSTVSPVAIRSAIRASAGVRPNAAPSVSADGVLAA